MKIDESCENKLCIKITHENKQFLKKITHENKQIV